ncbi:unnamed protein product [Bursaphelenchus xylophilus]|uniref:(pine wood nematode) hypothetical protein n=1 Tax=Bursaphelenchus xylophilus TaxID=6326 RepID=A0A1I7RZQ0_BURXY|nr:unnamed protein product [Bursaphelenchus xylophilus]CAG9111530.1 unnamed protein product [Bursaphelenchus xylophilus]
MSGTVEKLSGNFTIDSILEKNMGNLERESASPSSDLLKSQRRRSTFTALQVHILEAEFFQHRYVSPERRAFLASLLNLSQQQVKIWFQNRRYKTKTKPEGKARGTEQYMANLQAIWMAQQR